MDTIEILGGKPLTGSIKVGGSKNAALPIIAATVLLRSNVVLYNVPDIADVRAMLNICSFLGVSYNYSNGVLKLGFQKFEPKSLCFETVRKIRASYYFTPVLARFMNDFSIYKPGGCSFQARPIDLHLQVFESFGLKSEDQEDTVNYYKTKMHATTFEFPYKSVGATINSILMASIIDGVTTLNNVSTEVEVKCLIEFLRLHQVDIVEVEDTLVIKGRTFFNGATNYTLIHDRIEAGTYMLYGALLGDCFEIQNVPVKDLVSCFQVFDRLEVPYIIEGDKVTVSRFIPTTTLALDADAYPSFPSDLLPVLVAYLGQSTGINAFKDRIYPKRVDYFEELKKLGYVGTLKNDSLIVFPRAEVTRDATVTIKDLRGGASIILGALALNGKTIVKGYHHVERGYANLVDKLILSGADIHEI